MKCILKYFRIHLYIFICTHEQANIIKTQPKCFLLFNDFLWKGGYVQGDVFKHIWIEFKNYMFFSFRFLTVFALLEWNICCADFRFFHSRNPRLFIPYFYSFLFLIQPPRAESIFWREQHYVCLSLIFPRCNIWSKTQSMQFSTPSFQDIIMTNKCCHVIVCDSYILGIAGKAFESFQF